MPQNPPRDEIPAPRNQVAYRLLKGRFKAHALTGWLQPLLGCVQIKAFGNNVLWRMLRVLLGLTCIPFLRFFRFSSSLFFYLILTVLCSNPCWLLEGIENSDILKSGNSGITSRWEFWRRAICNFDGLDIMMMYSTYRNSRRKNMTTTCRKT